MLFAITFLLGWSTFCPQTMLTLLLVIISCYHRCWSNTYLLSFVGGAVGRCQRTYPHTTLTLLLLSCLRCSRPPLNTLNSTIHHHPLPSLWLMSKSLPYNFEKMLNFPLQALWAQFSQSLGSAAGCCLGGGCPTTGGKSQLRGKESPQDEGEAGSPMSKMPNLRPWRSALKVINKSQVLTKVFKGYGWNL